MGPVGNCLTASGIDRRKSSGGYDGQWVHAHPQVHDSKGGGFGAALQAAILTGEGSFQVLELLLLDVARPQWVS